MALPARVLVEAAGVEPASGGASQGSFYARSRFPAISLATIGAGNTVVRYPQCLSRTGRGGPGRSIPLASSLKGRGNSHQGRHGLSRESQVIVGSCWFPVVLREPGTRRATSS